MSLIDRTRGASGEEIWSYPIRTLTMFKRFTYSNTTEMSTNDTSGVVYDTFTLTAPPDKAVWLLGAMFTRDSRTNYGSVFAESWITRDDSLVTEGNARTNSTTYVTLKTGIWFGAFIPPDGSVRFRIWLRCSASNYYAYMKNVRVDILYAEVSV
jgi:hypothetical protein